jgi:VanZ family protein
MQNAFKLQMLDIRGWMMVIALGLVPLTFNELSKLFLGGRTASNRDV